MRKQLRALGVGALAAATIAGVGVMAGGGAAFAAGGGGSAPPWLSTETVAPLGSIIFYNAQGQVITGGNINDTQMAAYAVASAPAPAPGAGFSPYTSATLFENTPVANANPLTWTGGELSLKGTFPVTTAPGGIGTTSNPVVANEADVSLNNVITGFPNTQTAPGFAGLYDIRMTLSGLGSQPTNAYYETVVSVTGNTWSVDYPDFTQNTTTTLTANPQTQQSATPSPVTLTANVSPAAAGTVSFWNNSTTPATQVGTTQTVTGTSGTATVSTTPPTGTTPYQAIFTPAVPNSPTGTGNTQSSFDIGSQSSAVNVTAGPPADGTSTTLNVTGVGAAGPVTFTGAVSDTTTPASTPTGTVSLFDNGSTTPFATAAVGAGGAFSTTFTYSAAGSHSVVATYSGATGSPGWAASSSAAQAFSETAPKCTTCTDVQTITGTVPAGTISISTPYTPTNPLNLGTLALTPGGQYYTASAKLDPNAADVPTAGQSPNTTFNGITVVDTQSGNLPWTVSALASNLSDGTGNPGGSISGENVGLTGLTPVFVPGNAIVAGDVTTTNQTAATPPVGPTDTGSAGLGGGTPHVIAADTAQPDGTVGINGTVTLNAPTSTEAGVFVGTITFTIAS